MMFQMRITLEIDDDILRAVKELAEQSGSTAGRVVSDLARRALRPREETPQLRNGVPVLPPRAGERLVTPEDIEVLLDESSGTR